MLYASRCVSCGVSCSNWVSWVRRPLIRSCGYVPLVMCRSDAPRSTKICSRSAIFAAIVPPFVWDRDSLRQGDPQHLFDGRGPVQHLQEPRLAQRLHTLGLGDLTELGGRRVPEDRVPELLGDRHDLVDRDAALHAGKVARRAALALGEGNLTLSGGNMAVGHEALLVALVRFLACGTDLAAEALGQEEEEG